MVQCTVPCSIGPESGAPGGDSERACLSARAAPPKRSRASQGTQLWGGGPLGFEGMVWGWGFGV